MYKKYFITCLLILTTLSASFSPIFAKKATAQWVVFDPAAVAEFILKNAREFADMGARLAAQAAIQAMVNSTVTWARSGFRGNPAYAVNPKQYFTDIADGVAGDFIGATSSPISFLCSPFQAQIRLSLATEYTGQGPQFQCTLTGVVGNITAFYDDFSQGGWDGWFTMTQTESNNPYGAYIAAKVELDNRILKAVGLESQQLDWGDGFLSFKDCLATNPGPTINDANGMPIPNPAHVPGRAVGDCIQEGPTKTPGSVISAQLNQVLPANMNRYINAQHIEDLVNAFLIGSLNRFVFGSGGLF